MNNQTITSVIVSGLIKPAILLALIILIWWLLRKKSASLQHFILSIGLTGVFTIPLLDSGFIDSGLEIFPALSNVIQIPNAWLDWFNQWVIEHSSRKNILIVIGIYLLPACYFIFYFFIGVVGLWYQTRNAQVVQESALNAQLDAVRQLIDIRRPITLVVSKYVDSPQTWGLLRPVVMLPREALLWHEDRQLGMLIHELGHIARWDWLTTILVKITCAFFWFLLPIWWVAAQLYKQAEIACDDYIFKLRDKHLTYARSLLAIAGGGAVSTHTEGLQMSGHSPVYYRIKALLDERRPHQPVATETAQYWVICGALMLTLFASVKLIPLQEQLRQQAGGLLNIQWIDDNETTKLFADSEKPRIENFNWELLQHLKPALNERPDMPADFEMTRVRVQKPVRDDLRSGMKISLPLAEIPNIQIQGYLPVDMAMPEYPAAALEKGIEGWVKVEFVINNDGAILEPRIISHSPSGIFDRAVLSALKKSRYRPQLLNGQPFILNGVTEIFRFQLSDPDSRSRR